MSPYVGGGFGSKLWMRSDAVMAALGARAAGRPVKVALARPQIMQQHHAPPGDDPAHPHRRAASDGKITAIAHESWSGDLPGGGPETAANQTRLLYAGANRMTAHAARRCSTCPRAMRCARRARRSACWRSRSRWTSWPRSWRWTRSQLRILNDTQVDPEKPERAILAARPGRLPADRRASGSAGTSATRSRRRCATAAGWSAWAWRRRSAATSR